MTDKKTATPLTTPDPIVLAEVADSPTVEVRVWRDDALIHRQLCESAEDAASIVDHWSEIEGVRCEVDDLAVRHHPDQILDPQPENGFGDPDLMRSRRED